MDIHSLNSTLSISLLKAVFNVATRIINVLYIYDSIHLYLAKKFKQSI